MMSQESLNHEFIQIIDSLAEFAVTDYNLFSCERSHKSGGRVLLYIKSSLHPLVISKDSVENINAIFTHLQATLA